MRTGSSQLLALSAAFLLFTGQAVAEGQKPAQEESYAVVAGTVFQENGVSLRGAEVSLDPDPAARPKPKIRIRRIQADGRGEFAFRVPLGPMKYFVRAKAPGFEEDRKTVSVAGDERVDVFFALKRASAK